MHTVKIINRRKSHKFWEQILLGVGGGQHWTYKTGCLPVGAGIFGRLGSPRALTPGGEIECRVGSRDQRCFQGWPLDSPHVCHGIRHAGCPTLHSLASLLCSEFKPKVHGEGAVQGEGRADAKRRQRQSRFRTTHSSLRKKVLSRNSLAEMKKKKKQNKPWCFTQSLSGQFYITLLKIGYVFLSLPQPLAQQEFEVLWQRPWLFPLPHPLPTHPLPLFFSFMWIYLCLI